MTVLAPVAPGQSVLVQESYDPAWHAWSDGKPLEIRKDALGFIAIDAPPGDRVISLVFITPLENRVGRWVSALTAVVVLAMIVPALRKRSAS
jgi:uncharacterized membrane protein YfhO